jgi:hypothetical protein
VSVARELERQGLTDQTTADDDDVLRLHTRLSRSAALSRQSEGSYKSSGIKNMATVVTAKHAIATRKQ